MKRMGNDFLDLDKFFVQDFFDFVLDKKNSSGNWMEDKATNTLNKHKNTVSIRNHSNLKVGKV